MTSNFNKKKINLFPNKKFIKYFIITIIFFSIFFFTYNELRNRDRIHQFVKNISEKFNYQFLNLEINSQPGMTKLSLLPEQAKFKKIRFKNIVMKLINDSK